ncbi:MAG: 3'(2'),5'-bisphosphate nucleotidase CysQ [archaeon]
MVGFSKELVEAKRIARLAGKEVMKYYGSPDFTRKDDFGKTELTQADVDSNKVIVSELKKLFPLKIISEEENHDLIVEEEAYWLVDPLDGTRNFLKKDDQFVVMIALVRNNQPYLGVVYAPVKDEIYFAEKGKGAFLETPSGTHKLTVSFRKDLSDLKVVVSKNHLKPIEKDFINFLSLPLIQLGSAGLKLAKISSGELDVYPNLDGLNKWDICPGHAILQEAGGLVVDSRNNPLNYAIKDYRFRKGIIAINSDNAEFFNKLDSFLKNGR